MKKVYLSYSFKKIDQIFLESLENEFRRYGIQVVNKDTFRLHYYTDLASSMQNLINNCDLLIAFLTEANNNIIFELGYALGKGKKVLIVSDETVTMPEALENVSYIRSKYNDKLIYDIINYISSIKFSQQHDKIENFSDFKSLIESDRYDPSALDQIEPMKFEDFIYEWFDTQCVNIFRNENREDVGYDFLLTNYHNYKKTLVEVKKYNSNSKVSVGKIQQFLGAIYFNEADSGIFISSSGYTKSAINFAEDLNYTKRYEPKIELWDMDKIIKNLD